MVRGVRQAVILAAGRGERMRRRDAAARLTAAQEAAAERGWKALMPILGRPFLAWILDALGEIGIRRACLVVAAGDEELPRRAAGLAAAGPELSLAVQEAPRGTADAVLRARDWAGGEPFLTLNSDNYYPPEGLRLLTRSAEMALLALDRDEVTRSGRSNLTTERLRQWAVARTDRDGRLTDILEKPPAEVWDELPEPVLVSTNCWRLTPAVFEGCERIRPSTRGELELPAAVCWLVRHRGLTVRVVASEAPVLDLSARADVAAVSALLAAREKRSA